MKYQDESTREAVDEPVAAPVAGAAPPRAAACMVKK